MSLEQSPLARLLLIVLLLISGLYLGQQAWAFASTFGDIILLFFLAWLVGFILSPLANLLCRDSGIPRSAAVALVYLGLVLTLVLAGVLVVPTIFAQLSQISENLPVYGEQVPDLISSLQRTLDDRHINVQLSSVYSTSDLASRVEELFGAAVQNSLGWATGVASLLFNIVIVLVLSFYFVVDGERIAENALRLVPEPYTEEARTLLASVDRSFGGFLRGQVIQAAVCAVGTAIIMLVAGVNYVLLVTVLVAVAIIVPFIGPFLGLVFPLVVGAFQLTLPQYIVFAISLLVLQQIVFNISSPKVMSDAMGLHPLLVFLALLAGMKVAGIAGAIFGIPIAAVINAMVPVFYRRSKSIPAQLGGVGTAKQPASPCGGGERTGKSGALTKAIKAVEDKVKHGQTDAPGPRRSEP